MKLWYITNASMPSTKAHSLQILKSCEAFANAGVEVTLVLPTKVRVIRDDPFAYYGVKKNFRLQRILALDLIWLLPERLGYYLLEFSFACSAIIYALIHVRRGDLTYSRDIPTLVALCLLGFRPVAEIHDYRSQKPRWWMKYILKNARTMIVNSEGTKTLVGGGHVVPNAVDPDFFNIPETKEQAREKLNLPQDKIIIGYVGRTHVAGMNKGIASLEQAFQLMPERDRAHLLLVTSVPYREIPLYLRAIDIAVIPYPDEQHAKTTSPIKLYEYMAAHKTIVVADSADPKALADKLAAAIAHPDPYEGPVPTWNDRAKNILESIK